MPRPKLALAASLAALTAISLAACGSAAKPEAGTLKALRAARQGVDDPRRKHILCLRQDHLPVARIGTTAMQVGQRPYGPTIYFEATPGAAQNLQINGQVQGAEVIGSALLYPNQASDKLLAQVENCVALGVSG